MPTSWDGYEGDAGRALAERYGALDPEALNGWLRPILPDEPSTILDVGAGSGRDTAWLAGLGHEVVALEPSEAMRETGRSRHDSPSIRWI